MKEFGVNGTATPEEDEEHEDKIANVPIRGHPIKASRSMSPAVAARENGHTSMSAAGGQGAGTAKDSFLNYFFGKEGGLPPPGPPIPGAASSGSRHVSHSTEPSFAQSIRRADGRSSFVDHSPAMPTFPTHLEDFPVNSDYADSSLLVSSLSLPFPLRLQDIKS